MRKPFNILKMSHVKLKLKRLFRITYVIIFLGLSNICPIYSASIYAQTTRLSVNLSQVSIKDVIRFVEQKSEYVFFYSGDVYSELEQNVTVNAKSKTIDEILTSVLKNTDLTYTLNDRQVIINHQKETQQSKK